MLAGVKMSHASGTALCRSLKVQCELYPTRELILTLDPYSGLGASPFYHDNQAAARWILRNSVTPRCTAAALVLFIASSERIDKRKPESIKKRNFILVDESFLWNASLWNHRLSKRLHQQGKSWHLQFLFSNWQTYWVVFESKSCRS